MIFNGMIPRIYSTTGQALAVVAAVICCEPNVAAAASPLSEEIALKGITATRDRLRGAGPLKDEENFALAGMELLRGVEEALQARWRVGLSNDLEWLPVMRLPIPENPNPDAFDPGIVSAIFRQVVTRAVDADATLSQISEGSDFKLEIETSDIWFDINANGQADPGESFAEVMGLALPPEVQRLINPDEVPTVPSFSIHFDVADAFWLKAYANLIAGVGETVVAYDPTKAIGDVVRSRAKFAEMGSFRPSGMFDFVGIADIVAIVKNALDQQPDRAGLQRAHSHFLTMVKENRVFWRLVDLETDNDAEWIPNARQTSALGLEFPPETGAVWQGVLADAEALLRGEALAPYWQLDGQAGINVKRMLLEPRPIDLLNWIQGQDALPYIERGQVMSLASWSAFENLVVGDALMFAIILN